MSGPAALRHGVVLLPEQRWQLARRNWERAEEFGFDHAWTYDHLLWRWLRDKPWFATVPTLAAAAVATRRIRLGTLVASPSFRHPVTFAKEMMTLDDLADGRMICGIGAGGGGYDDEVLGCPPPSARERADRFAEFVELTDQLLRFPETTFEGGHYTACGAQQRPGCVQRPRIPLAVAATGPRGLGLAARHADIWVTAGRPGWSTPTRFDRAAAWIGEQSKRLDEECAELGRDPAAVRRLVVTGAIIDGVVESAASYQDACACFAEVGITDVVTHWPRADFPYRGSLDVLADIAGTVLTPRGAQ